jgi:hypothetical protein
VFKKSRSFDLEVEEILVASSPDDPDFVNGSGCTACRLVLVDCKICAFKLSIPRSSILPEFSREYCAFEMDCFVANHR